MAKNYEEVAMDVIREDWEYRKNLNNSAFNQERIARMMGISRSQFAKALGENKNPTISFICRYATAVGRPIDARLLELLETDHRKLKAFILHRLAKMEFTNFTFFCKLVYGEFFFKIISNLSYCRLY